MVLQEVHEDIKIIIAFKELLISWTKPLQRPNQTSTPVFQAYVMETKLNGWQRI